MFKTWPKIKGELVFDKVGKAQNLKNIPTLNRSNCILYIVPHVATKMRYGVVRLWFWLWLNSKPYRTALHM